MSVVTMHHFKTSQANDAARAMLSIDTRDKVVLWDIAQEHITYGVLSTGNEVEATVIVTEITEAFELIRDGYLSLSGEYGSTDEQGNYKPTRMLLIEEHHGCVLATYERNGYDDSDFYAVVWTGTYVQHIEYASTRGWSYCNHADVDATSEVIEAANEWAYNHCLATAWERAADDVYKLQVGSTCEIVKGRNNPKGLTFTVTGVYDNAYDKHNRRVYGRDAQGNQINTYEYNVKVLFDADMMLSEAEIIRNARAAANNLIASRYRSF